MHAWRYSYRLHTLAGLPWRKEGDDVLAGVRRNPAPPPKRREATRNTETRGIGPRVRQRLAGAGVSYSGSVVSVLELQWCEKIGALRRLPHHEYRHA